MASQPLPIATLIASKPKRPELLLRALASVGVQNRRPDLVVIVFDRRLPSSSELEVLAATFSRSGAVILLNQRTQGAAGAWNTGLTWLQDRAFGGYVALLDDDDEWDPDHLSECESASDQSLADVVLSGLRLIKDGVEQPRLPLSAVNREDFLAGNPGWQGSNTYVKLGTLMRVGGFTDGLPSTNDRDLAVRILSLPELQIGFTHRMTATWHIDSQADSLSRPGSAAKRDGLLQFLAMHGHLMTPEIMVRFRTRARELFGVEVP